MISKNIKVVGISTAALIAVVAIWYSQSYQGNPKPPAINIEEFRAEQQEKDFATLQEASPPSTELFGAMIRMGQLRKPIARDKALELISRPEALLRSGAARTLANFDDSESWSALQKLCKDSEASVRAACLASITALPSADRKSFVESEFVGRAKSDIEKIDALIALLAFEKDDAKRSSALKVAVDFARGKAQLESKLLSRLVNVAPRNPELTRLLHSTLQNPDQFSVTMRTLAIRHLAAIRNPQLLELYPALADSPEVEIKTALLQTFTSMCPPARWTFLEKFLNEESDPKLRSEALRVLSIMPTEDARVLLERLIAGGKFTEASERERAQMTLKALAKDPRVDPCLGRNKINY